MLIIRQCSSVLANYWYQNLGYDLLPETTFGVKDPSTSSSQNYVHR